MLRKLSVLLKQRFISSDDLIRGGILSSGGISRFYRGNLINKGVSRFYHEVEGSALQLSIGTLEELGYTAERAREIATIFEQHEHKSIRELANFPLREEGYFRRAREQIAILERAVSTLPVIPPK